MDLEHEAQAQRSFARAYRGHPFVWVPAPVTELCHADVLVSEWVEGADFDAVLARGQDERDRYGEILVAFHAGAALHTGAFHADVHPGNHRLLADGRVAFMDFGSTGRAEPVWLAGLLDAADAARDGDGDRLRRELADLGYLGEPERVDGHGLLALTLSAGGWLLEDRPVRIEPAFGRTLTRDAMANHRAALEDLTRAGRLPARDLLAGRMVGGLGAVLARLEATASWGPLVFGEPSTELGEQDAAFWSSRGHSRGSTVHDLRRAA